MTHTDSWLMRPQANPGARLRLFCFPYAGGGASIYRQWLTEMPAPVEVCAVQLPGREARLREQPFKDLPTLVAAAADGLAPYMDKPFAFFGHSMGAMVAYELARELRRRGQTGPVHLFLSGRRAAHLPDSHPMVHGLPDEEFKQELRRLGGTPEAVLEHQELMEMMLPMLRADFQLVETYAYHPEEPLVCPIAALGGLADAEAGQPELAPWRQHTTGDFSLRMFPGGHFFLHDHRQALQRYIVQDLALHLM
jgi:medium-chain acyl-[acyl-carrier-protein] hydrolase